MPLPRPALAALLLTAAGCTPAPPPPPPAAPAPAWFEDVTDKVGVDFTHACLPANSHFTPLSMGSGCAVFDADGDGRPDLLFLQLGGPGSGAVNRLYLQRSPGRFEDATAGSGLDVDGYNHGTAVGDVDGDGKPDVVVTQYGGIRLFLNRGGGKFADATAPAGLADPQWGMSAAFLDYDRDGRLDLFVVNYLTHDPAHDCFAPNGAKDFCGPSAFPPATSRLFRNLGPGPAGGVRFEDVSAASGVGQLPGPGLGVAVFDADGDGWADVFVANDGAPNRLWVNQKDGTFKDEAAARGLAVTMLGKAFAGMGVAVGDVDGDGLVDVYVTHLNTETNTLWKQGPRGVFRDLTGAAGLAGTRGTGFGTVLADFDNDGRPDLGVVNGRVYLGGPARDSGLGFWETYAEKNLLLANVGGGRFKDVSADNPAVCGHWNVGRGLVAADLDGDGGLDLVLTTAGGKARVFRNVAPGRGNWTAVRAVGPDGRDAVGAEIRLRVGGAEQVRVVSRAVSYLCAGPAEAHFGLGPAAAAESIQVRWPDGTTERFPGGPAGRVVELRRGGGSAP